MLAMFGLISLAIAGTAFVGLSAMSAEDPSDDIDQELAKDSHDTAEDTTEASNDLLNEFNFGGDVDDVVDSVNEAAGVALAPQSETQNSDVTVSENSDGNLIITGTDTEDLLLGDDGDDFFDAESGDDTLFGGAGVDQMHGDAGDDQIFGGDGDDQIYGHVGDDDLTGDDGDDEIHAGEGDDSVLGGAGDDLLSGGYGDDTLIGGAGRDNIQGSEGDDLVDGVTGEDVAEKDYLNGSEGDDTLRGNGYDVMSGGTGADQFEAHISSSGGTVSIMDFSTSEDVLIVNYDGDPPVLTKELTSSGVTLLADGEPVVDLFGLEDFDMSSVHLAAA